MLVRCLTSIRTHPFQMSSSTPKSRYTWGKELRMKITVHPISLISYLDVCLEEEQNDEACGPAVKDPIFPFDRAHSFFADASLTPYGFTPIRFINERYGGERPPDSKIFVSKAWWTSHMPPGMYPQPITLSTSSGKILGLLPNNSGSPYPTTRMPALFRLFPVLLQPE
jgi:hypothetical protein